MIVRMESRWIGLAALAALLGACAERGPNAEADPAAEVTAAEAPRTSPVDWDAPASADAAPGAAAAADWGALESVIVQYVDSVDRQLRRVPNLTGAERGHLRRDVNATQIERARQLGIRPGADVDALVRAGRLVRLPDTTRHWVVRELDYSVPYVTPDAAALLVDVAQRFQARLDSLGVPRYRLDITSVLRTTEKQAELRRRNANASRTESAHEFGTTVDIAYRNYAPPASAFEAAAAPALRPLAREVGDSLLVQTANLRGAELQAVLGRVLRELQDEGKVLVRMENRQTVYHITVARRYPRTDAVAVD